MDFDKNETNPSPRQVRQHPTKATTTRQVPALTIVSSVILGWIMSWFGFDNVFRNGMREMFDLQVTNSSYYLAFAAFGLLCTIISLLKRKTP